MSYEVKDSGERRSFDTGAVRDMATGKGRMDLLPFFALLELGKLFEAGALKYDADNWRKGIPLRVFLDSAIRHLFKFGLGMRDERHDVAAAWNILCLMETKHMVDRGLLPRSLDNLPDFFNLPAGNGVLVGHPNPEAIRQVERDALAELRGEDVPSRDFSPVEELDDWFNRPEIIPDPRPAWATTGHPKPPLGKPKLEYTRGHAEETAERFNAGLAYRDSDGETPELDAEQIIAPHPLFSVTVINGEDVQFYDGPETCVLDDRGCGCIMPPPEEPNPLDGQAYAILKSGPASTFDGDERRWFVRDGKVRYAQTFGEQTAPSVLTLAQVRAQLAAGYMVLEEVGTTQGGE